jgi:hypothetical protein
MGAEATLSDYFDLIGGTSTGGIIATLLALGKSVDDVTSEYLGLGEKVFSRRTWPARIPGLGFLFTRLSARPLEAAAKRIFSEKTTLGSPSVETGLCIVTKRADTYSTWPYLNHPQARFYAENAEIPLWKLIRATSAAPTFFYPIKIEIGRAGRPDYGVFVDGGVSMANNPAFQLFLVATLRGFPFGWKAGADRLLLVSVGTGRFDDRLYERDLLKFRPRRRRGRSPGRWAHSTVIWMVGRSISTTSVTTRCSERRPCGRWACPWAPTSCSLCAT